MPLLEEVLKESGPDYSIAERLPSPREGGNLMHSGGLYAQIEINRRGDRLFDQELGELREEVEECEGKRKERKAVLETLKVARATVAVQVLWQDRGTVETLQRIDPIWKWLFANRKGLL